MKKALKILAYITGVLLSLILVFVLAVWVKSPGSPDIVIDKSGNEPPNAVSVIETIPIGGIQQAIIIRGEDASKPVLLMLHGGPGAPVFPFMKNYGLDLEKEFVVAHWEQRGTGKSYHADIPIESMTMTQMIADAVEVTKYLQTRFKQEKIYLMGHSWGSLLGTMLAHQNPELFHSLVSIGQVCRQFHAEKLSLDWVKAEVQKSGNQSDKANLNTLIFPDSLADNKTWRKYLIAQRNFVRRYGGGLKHKNLDMMKVYKTVIFNTPEYTLQNKINYLRGALFSIEHLWDDIMQTNLFQEIDSIAIPVHIFQGIHDYQTPFEPAKAYFDQLKAPDKYFYQFDESAHFPFLDETEKFNKIIREEVLELEELIEN